MASPGARSGKCEFPQCQHELLPRSLAPIRVSQDTRLIEGDADPNPTTNRKQTRPCDGCGGVAPAFSRDSTGGAAADPSSSMTTTMRMETLVAVLAALLAAGLTRKVRLGEEMAAPTLE